MSIPSPTPVFVVAINSLLLTLQRLWEDLKAAADEENLLIATVGFLLLAVVLIRYVPAERRRIRAAAWLFAFSLFLILLSSVFASSGFDAGRVGTRHAAFLIGGIAIINLVSIFVFDVILHLMRVDTPRILRDLMVAFGYVGVGFALLSRSGVSLSSIITTSAVLTAVIAFALQDTLGNIMGGLALQMDRTIEVGDWVKIDQAVGRVKEIRWRHTAIETRNWDTIIIPNSVMIRNHVLIYGRRAGQPVQHRQWVYFNVDFRIPPTDVIRAVTEALQAETIPGVAAEPQPHCILYDFKESYCHYAVRYWLVDIAADDPTDSIIRTRIYFALKRANVPLSIPAHSIFVTQESEERKELKHEKDVEHRLRALANVELFNPLNEGERRLVAERLLPAPFTKGEAMMRQGTEAHRLYIITMGSATVQLSTEDGVGKEIATLKAGDFFGEMGLMTGERRSATVTALEDVECYRLDKDAFHDILLNRPEIAEYISHVLARRRMEYEAARDGLDAEARNRKMGHAQRDIFARISEFFGLGAKAQV
ncbi:MAG TPA: mechanosensitive ion channel family protein [Blastocatellia bacterium]|nr:mechanosensitive ion channel family protein [Blastocatellia bacterium]